MIFTQKGMEPSSWGKKAFNIVLVWIVVIGLFWISFRQMEISFSFSFIEVYKTRILDGFLLTIKLSILSFILSLVIGILSALGQKTKILFLRYLSRGYVSFIRGTPLIMQIYLFYYIVGTAWGIENRFLAGVLILSVFEGAYIGEILRGSFASIDAIQLEAAQAVGFNKKQTLKHIIFPQMMASALPALTGQLASIIKDSSLLSIIAVIELTQTMREISADTFLLFESYALLGILYLALTLPLSYISQRLERRFTYAH